MSGNQISRIFAKLIRSSKNKIMLEEVTPPFTGHKYSKRKINADGSKVFWRCVNRDGCTATVHTGPVDESMTEVEIIIRRELGLKIAHFSGVKNQEVLALLKNYMTSTLLPFNVDFLLFYYYVDKVLR